MQYIFKYIKGGKLLGYHHSTFCQFGSKSRAKVYNLPTPDKVKEQLEIIRGNFESVKHCDDNPQSFLYPFKKTVKDEYFEGDMEDIKIVPEEIDSAAEPKTKSI